MSYKDIEPLISFLNYPFLLPDHISRTHFFNDTHPTKFQRLSVLLYNIE